MFSVYSKLNLRYLVTHWMVNVKIEQTFTFFDCFYGQLFGGDLDGARTNYCFQMIIIIVVHFNEQTLAKLAN